MTILLNNYDYYKFKILDGKKVILLNGFRIILHILFHFNTAILKIVDPNYSLKNLFT